MFHQPLIYGQFQGKTKYMYSFLIKILLTHKWYKILREHKFDKDAHKVYINFLRIH